MARTPARVLGLAVVLLAAVAAADDYDFKIRNLGNPQSGGTNHNPNANGNFRAFARQFGAAMTSVNLAPAETLGHSGFAFSAELSVVSFGSSPNMPLADSNSFVGSATGRSDTQCDHCVPGTLLIPSVHVRKGLPFSFEFGARGAWIEKSRMGTATLELKWAVNEGFTYLPDIAVGGNVTKVINSRDFDLTAGGLDIGIGKQFAVGGMVTITPYIGWNLNFVGASSNSIDFNPARSLADSEKPENQYTDFYIFESVFAAANSHNRFYGGIRFIGGVVMVGAEFSYSVIPNFSFTRDDGMSVTYNVPAVMAINGTIGLDF